MLDQVINSKKNNINKSHLCEGCRHFSLGIDGKTCSSLLTARLIKNNGKTSRPLLEIHKDEYFTCYLKFPSKLYN